MLGKKLTGSPPVFHRNVWHHPLLPSPAVAQELQDAQVARVPVRILWSALCAGADYSYVCNTTSCILLMIGPV